MRKRALLSVGCMLVITIPLHAQTNAPQRAEVQEYRSLGEIFRKFARDTRQARRHGLLAVAGSRDDAAGAVRGLGNAIIFERQTYPDVVTITSRSVK